MPWFVRTQLSVAGLGVVDGAPPEQARFNVGALLTCRFTCASAAVPAFGVAVKVPE
jgi:hypothetical protein